jgi:predicted PurR-regulated permease PerM
MSAEHWIAVAAVCVTIIGGFIGLGMLIISYINNIKDTLTSQLSVISHDIANLERFYDKRFEVIDERFEAINKRFDAVDNELILLRGEISRLNQNHIEHLTNHNK